MRAAWREKRRSRIAKQPKKRPHYTWRAFFLRGDVRPSLYREVAARARGIDSRRASHLAERNTARFPHHARRNRGGSTERRNLSRTMNRPDGGGRGQAKRDSPEASTAIAEKQGHNQLKKGWRVGERGGMRGASDAAGRKQATAPCDSRKKMSQPLCRSPEPLGAGLRAL